MKNVRAIHPAVTFALIITMMFQPMLLTPVMAGCVEDVQPAEAPKCVGCGCCEVDAAGERCCCCCRNRDPSSDESVRHRCDNSGETDAAREQDRSVLGVCLCGLTFPPMERGTEHSLERVQIRDRDCPTIVLSIDEDGPSSGWATAGSMVRAQSSSRFSQRHLCVWRI